MKSDIAKFIAKCAICQQVKVKHQKLGGLLQSLSIPEWKWDHITMDFMLRLPRTTKGHNAMCMIVDRLTKTDHFVLIKTMDTLVTLSHLYIREIVRLHEVPLSIVSDQDSYCVAKFW